LVTYQNYEVLLSTYENSFSRPTSMTSSRYIPVRNMCDFIILPGCPAALIWLVSVVSGEQTLKDRKNTMSQKRRQGSKLHCTTAQKSTAAKALNLV